MGGAGVDMAQAQMNSFLAPIIAVQNALLQPVVNDIVSKAGPDGCAPGGGGAAWWLASVGYLEAALQLVPGKLAEVVFGGEGGAAEFQSQLEALSEWAQLG